MTLMQMPFLKKRKAENRTMESNGRGAVAGEKSPAKVAAAQKGRNTIRKSFWIGLGAIVYAELARF
jgi:hypothetical protein